MGTQGLVAGRGYCLFGWQPAFQQLKQIIYYLVNAWPNYFLCGYHIQMLFRTKNQSFSSVQAWDSIRENNFSCAAGPELWYRPGTSVKVCGSKYVAGPADSQPCCGANGWNISLPVSEIDVVAGISRWASQDFCPDMEMHTQSQNTLKIAMSTIHVLCGG